MPMRKQQIRFQLPCTFTYWNGRCRQEIYFCGLSLFSSGTAWEGQSVSILLLCITFVADNPTRLLQDMIPQSQTRRANSSMKKIYMPIRSSLSSVLYWLLGFGYVSNSKDSSPRRGYFWVQKKMQRRGWQPTRTTSN